MNVGKIGSHVGQKIGRRIADLVKRLLGNHCRHDQASGAVRLGDHKASVAAALCDGIPDIVPIGHLLPIAECSAGRLRSAFQDVANQTAGAKAVVVVRRPAELVHQDAERKGAIGASAGDDNVGGAVKGCLDGKCAEIGVRRQQPRRQPLA